MTDSCASGWRRLNRFVIASAMTGVLLLVSAAGWASFGGGGAIHLGFWGMFVAAAVMAIPVGIACALIEWFGARHGPPVWIGSIAGAGGLYCAVRALGWTGRADDIVFWFAVPPLITLALVAIVRLPLARLGTVWLFAVGGLLLAVYKQWPGLPPANYSEMIGALAGGAVISMLLWQFAYWLRQLQDSRAHRREAPRASGAAAPIFAEPVRHHGHAAAELAASATAGAASAAKRLPLGLGWFLAGTLIFYIGIGVLILLGNDSLSAAMRGLQWRIADYFGFRTDGLNGEPLRVWVGHGILWAMVAGLGTWGAAAVAGRFDPGQLRYLRFAAVVLCGIMLLSVAMVASNTKLY